MPERLTSTIVPPCGPLDAKLCFIGEAPGEEEDLSGEPFVGSAGQFLNNVFRQVGITRSLVLLNNVFNQRPPANDITYFYENKTFGPRSKFVYTWEGQEHIDNLKWWLDNLKPRPNLLVALGKHAIYALTGKKRVWRWRGSILPCTLSPNYKVYCSLHPSAVMRLINEPEEELQGHKKDQARNALPLFINDLERCVIQSEFPEFEPPKRQFDISLSFEELCNKLRYIKESRIDCAIDIETIPFGPEGPILWCIGFGLKPSYAFIVPFIYRQRFAWTLPQEALLLKLISEYFLCPAKKIFQYGNYDLSVLGRYYGLRVADGTYEDTMWCFHSAFPQLMKGLHVLTSMYTWEPYYKDEGKINYGRRTDDNAEFIYNGKDCCVTRECFPALAKQAREMDTWSGYRRSMSYLPSLFAMIIKGVKCDLSKKERLGEDYARQVEFHKNQISEIEGEPINPNSPKQLTQLLYYKHQFKEQRKRNRARTLTADKNALNNLRRLYPNEPVINHIVEFKKFSKLVSQYTKMKVDCDDRIHTSYGFVSTWRLNSSESPFGSGGNLQNIPGRTPEGRAIRELFITDDMPAYSDSEWPKVLDHVTKVTNGAVTPVNGRMLMVARDLSQAEARFVVWDAEDMRTMELFLDGSIDVHWERTKEIFGINHSYDPHEEIEVPLIHDFINMKDLRTLGKTAKHAGNYGMGPMRFMMILNLQGFHLPYAQCRKILKATVDNDPYLQAWHQRIREEVKATRYLVTPPPFSRKRFFHGRFNENLYRAAYAFKPQSTVGELITEAIQNIFTRCAHYLDILLNVHDEVIYQVPPHLLGQSLVDTREELEIPIELNSRTLVIPAEAKAGLNWGQLEEFKPNLS